MLTVTRTEGEWVDLYNGGTWLASIQLREIQGGKRARIGVEAPDHVRILRRELDDHQLINKETK